MLGMSFKNCSVQEKPFNRETFCCHVGGEVVDGVMLDRETWSLNKDEADAVRKRVDTLNATLKKQRQQRADVREVFAAPKPVRRSAVMQESV